MRWQVGRTGKLTPVAELAPVPSAERPSATRRFITWTKSNGWAIKIGDWVQVERGGDVIPKVAKVIDDDEKDHPRGKIEIEIPEKCPVCGNKVVRTEGEVDYRCVNAELPRQTSRDDPALRLARRDEH